MVDQIFGSGIRFTALNTAHLVDDRPESLVSSASRFSDMLVEPIYMHICSVAVVRWARDLLIGTFRAMREFVHYLRLLF